MGGEPRTFLCVVVADKGVYGEPFLAELKRLGHRVVVLTQADKLALAWPRQDIDELFAVPDVESVPDVLKAVSYVARWQPFARVVGLGEFDVTLAAAVREHLGLPGWSASLARRFRDKLAMRVAAAGAGVRVPPFVPLFGRDAIRRFLAAVPGPWLLKPRYLASSRGIQKLATPDEAWAAIDALGDAQAEHLLERYVAGTVYHVDAVVDAGAVRYAAVHQYGTPILELHAGGGVYTSYAIRRGTAVEQALQQANRELLAALGLPYGVAHAEFIRDDDGGIHFVEVGARIGGGGAEHQLAAGAGVDFWHEWARLELAAAGAHAYQPPTPNGRYGGIVACMAPVAEPDLSPYLAPGVTPFPGKAYHATLLAVDEDPDALARTTLGLAARLRDDLMVHAAR